MVKKAPKVTKSFPVGSGPGATFLSVIIIYSASEYTAITLGVLIMYIQSLNIHQLCCIQYQRIFSLRIYGNYIRCPNNVYSVSQYTLIMLRSYLGYKWKRTGTEVGFRSVILVLMVKNSPIFNLKTKGNLILIENLKVL